MQKIIILSVLIFLSACGGGESLDATGKIAQRTQYASGFNASSIENPQATEVVSPYEPDILDGEEATPHAWPWMIAISKNGRTVNCGGVLIDKQWVLTAAHCLRVKDGDTNQHIDMTDVRFIAGAHDMWNLGVETQSRKAQFVRFYGDKSISDMAIVRLEAPLLLNKAVYPINLPNANEGFLYAPATPVMATGWGATTHDNNPPLLQQIKASIVGDAECRQEMEPLYPLRNEYMCATTAKAKAPICNGDSGGPLVTHTASGWKLLGLTSFHVAGCTGKSSAFVRTLDYLGWIKGYTGALPVFMDDVASFNTRLVFESCTSLGIGGLTDCINHVEGGMPPYVISLNGCDSKGSMGGQTGYPFHFVCRGRRVYETVVVTDSEGKSDSFTWDFNTSP